jgi:hypothetical protein
LLFATKLLFNIEILDKADFALLEIKLLEKGKYSQGMIYLILPE